MLASRASPQSRAVLTPPLPALPAAAIVAPRKRDSANDVTRAEQSGLVDANDDSSISGEAAPPLSRDAILSTLSQLRVLRAKWGQAEMERRREVERWQLAEAQCRAMSAVEYAQQRRLRRRAASADGSVEEEAEVAAIIGADAHDEHDVEEQKQRTLRNIERKLARIRIANTAQRAVLRRVVRLMRHRHMRAALHSLRAVGAAAPPSASDPSSSESESKTFLTFLSDVAFFSACLRQVRREVELLLVRKSASGIGNERQAREPRAEQEKQRQRDVLIEFARVATLMSRPTRSIIVSAVNSRAAAAASSASSSSSSPREIIAMLFAGTKAGVFVSFRECMPLLEGLLRAVDPPPPPSLVPPRRPTAVVFSAVDTVRLSLWLATVAVAAAADGGRRSARAFAADGGALALLLLRLCDLVYRLWRQHAMNFGGVGAKEPWLLLSCVPELDAFAALLARVAADAGAPRSATGVAKTLALRRAGAVQELLVEGLRGATAPISSEHFAQPWNGKQLVNGDRIALLEQQLATNMDPRRLFSLLALLGDARALHLSPSGERDSGLGRGSARSVQQRNSVATTSASIARGAVFRALSRSLHRITLAQAGSLLMLVAGPGLDDVRTAVEGEAAAALIDAIVMRALQLLERYARNPSGAVASPSSPFGTEQGRGEAALMTVRICTALSHLSARQFLLAGRASATATGAAAGGGGDGGTPITVTSRALCASTVSTARSPRGASRVSLEHAVTLCVAALVASDGGALPGGPLIDRLSAQSRLAMQRALADLNMLTPARESLLATASQPSNAEHLDSVEAKLESLKRRVLQKGAVI